MKNTSQWAQKLVRRLADYQDELGELTVSQFINVELGLFLINELLPNVPPIGALPALLCGNDYPFAEKPLWSTVHQQYVFTARFLIGSFRHSSIWRDLLLKYSKIPERLRGYVLEDLETTVERQSVSICADRFDHYDAALVNIMPTQSHTINWAQAGNEYIAEASGVRLHLRLPNRLPHYLVQKHALRTHSQRVPLEILLTELLAIASWMDKECIKLNITDYGNWAERVSRLRIDTYQQAIRQFIKDDRLTLDGVTNVVGMLSAGKSTFMDVLAVWAAQNGFRITLIVNDVSDVLRRCNFFYRLRLPVAPMLGKSSREQHLSRLQAMEAERIVMLDNMVALHQGFHWLSTACSLPAIAPEGPSFPVNRHPCIALIDKDEQVHACPLYSTCGYHNAQRELVDALIWVGTPASLLRTKVDRQLTESTTQFAELVYRNSDIVVVDEADRVQVQFDLAFSPGQTLANDPYSGWLDMLVRHIRDVQTKQGRKIRSDTLAATFRRVLDTANVDCERLYDLLMAEERLRQWVSIQQYFTGWLLFDHLADSLIDNRAGDTPSVHPPLPPVFQSFLEGRDPLGEDFDHQLSTFARSFIATDFNRERLWQQVINWLNLPAQRDVFTKVLPEVDQQYIVLKLEFTLLLSVLENRLNYIVKNWNQVEGVFGLSEWGQNLFADPPRDYLSLIPMAPAGNVLAFRYEGNEKDGTGKLSFFKNLGIGRHFLLNFHRLYEVDNIPGPHVLLLSGTSWAGSSPSYHLQLPVKAVLRSPEQELDGIGQSQFTFWPVLGLQNKPIKVSGKNGQQRYQALEQLVRALAKKDSGSGRSQLESNWSKLPPERQRALFIVGSYREAKVVRDYLVRLRPDWSEQVVALIPDSESFDENQTESEQTIQRGKVHEFAQRGGLILIAPLMAIERGHNILNDLRVAALGTAYFLVRPHPHPDDIGLAVKAINHWALDHYNQAGWFQKKIGYWPVPADQLHRRFKYEAIKRWNNLMRMPVRFSTMPDNDLQAFYWDQLVSIWQVIGRLIRGGVPANVYFCDAAFAEQSVHGHNDTARSSLLVGLLELLTPYFDPESDVCSEDRAIVKALYQPFYQALKSTQGLHYANPKSQLATPNGV